MGIVLVVVVGLGGFVSGVVFMRRYLYSIHYIILIYCTCRMRFTINNKEVAVNQDHFNHIVFFWLGLKWRDAGLDALRVPGQIWVAGTRKRLTLPRSSTYEIPELSPTVAVPEVCVSSVYTELTVNPYETVQENIHCMVREPGYVNTTQQYSSNPAGIYDN